MDYIRVSRIDNVILHKKGIAHLGTLHLTTHHLIFTSLTLAKEFWFPYPLINAVFKNTGSALLSKYKSAMDIPDLNKWYEENDMWNVINIKIIGKDYTIFSIDFPLLSTASDVYDSTYSLTILQSPNQLYAWLYTPTPKEKTLNSWSIYSPAQEFKRQGMSLEQWRISDVNQNYTFAGTYPAQLIVPKQCSDTLLKHAAKYRSKSRIPVLTYYYKKQNCSITRAAQPLPGLTKQRSIQDENLIQTTFNLSTVNDHNIIVDARPLKNAIAQIALGGGTELMDNYNFSHTTKRLFLGIDNIHIMSDTVDSLVDNYLIDGDIFHMLQVPTSPKFQNWLKYVTLILTSVETLSKAMIFNGSNLLVHCSDGWDRTAQITSLIQLCIDPYFRTYEGFMVLVEKDWVSFGHKFRERSNNLGSNDIFHDNTTTTRDKLQQLSRKTLSNSNDSTNKFASPIFQQFIDCVYQLQLQNPTSFEFNERFLRRLIYHLYSCQYGTFLFNSQKEIQEFDAQNKTRSVWDHFRSKPTTYTNKNYNPVKDTEFNDTTEDWISPDLSQICWWSQLYGHPEMNNQLNETTANDVKETTVTNGIVESTRELLSFFNLNKKD